jgi:uncharacterized protein
MPREKNTRKLSLKPIYKIFVPQSCIPEGITTLLHEEIEAIYLMDVLNLYQVDAAKKMEVSRPTFTRILKNARQKLANALICGHAINFQDEKEESILAIASDDTKRITNSNGTSKYILLYQKSKTNLKLLDVLDNPSFNNKAKPAVTLPNFLLSHNVNIFIASKIGEGLKNSLVIKGIKILLKDISSVSEL